MECVCRDGLTFVSCPVLNATSYFSISGSSLRMQTTSTWFAFVCLTSSTVCCHNRHPEGMQQYLCEAGLWWSPTSVHHCRDCSGPSVPPGFSQSSVWSSTSVLLVPDDPVVNWFWCQNAGSTSLATRSACVNLIWLLACPACLTFLRRKMNAHGHLVKVSGVMVMGEVFCLICIYELYYVDL